MIDSSERRNHRAAAQIQVTVQNRHAVRAQVTRDPRILKGE